MKEMVAVLVNNNGTIESFEMNAIGLWFQTMDINHRRKTYKGFSYEDCGEFIFKIYKRSTQNDFKQYIKGTHARKTSETSTSN